MTKSLATRSRDRAWGAPVFAGTRVPVGTLDEFLRQFPTVTREQAIELLEEAKRGATKVTTTA